MTTGSESGSARPGTRTQPAGRSAETELGLGWQKMTGDLPVPLEAAERHDLLWQQLVAQFRWYNRAATGHRRGYLVLKIVALVLGGAVTVLAAISAPAGLTASLAAGIVAAEGLQQVFQMHANWISYRTTAEALRQQAFLYTARVDPYADPATRRDRLADVVRTITANENNAWTKAMQPAPGAATSA
ncbi:DUF4231 domain-containing protein [Jatrophihabitans sp.]|uniref:DUF4231 domain-containing protein n=1 Tax=Jatrophihabitans sp. TaxID=1932789 RepID=UPI002B8BCB09|nr:DUF4231 domain-containing protein [Jatrophihabitans sp.]